MQKNRLDDKVGAMDDLKDHTNNFSVLMRSINELRLCAIYEVDNYVKILADEN